MKVCDKCKSVNAQESEVCYFCGATLPVNANIVGANTQPKTPAKPIPQQPTKVSQPQPKKPEPKELTFWDAIGECMGKYASFKGRASRKELWYFLFFCTIVIGISIAMEEEIMWFSISALLLPMLAAIGRRLHDIGRGRWWAFILLIIPFYGWALLALMCILPSQQKDNEYGPYIG